MNAADLYMPALVAHELAFGVQLIPYGTRRDLIVAAE
ncbi:hypothetical protein Lxx13870 [Leifsonia xyli subsp. xyli str. CTCB07]|uniref:Uncharacterized protein n=1 Tax=Leifsonia xyli subsp. xyli (strain CTCB07) TaxID=281090 RepID=Q6AEI7_LEIXX|nr:hypothetical protein Lxx13870 [Leifsonia xyli subsp. xyli str. CTCB07]